MLKLIEQELKILEKQCEDDIEALNIQKWVSKSVLELVELFLEQSHSGFSASYVLDLFTKCMNNQPLTPLTGEGDEWEDVSWFGVPDGYKSMQQNKRCSAVFRYNSDNSTAFYLHGKSFSEDGGHTWFSNHDSVVSITFPYTVNTESIILK